MGIVVTKPLPYQSIPFEDRDNFTSINMTRSSVEDGVPLVVPTNVQKKHFSRVLTPASRRGKSVTGNVK